MAAAIYTAGRLHQPDYAFSLFGADPVPPKSLLATIVLALALAVVQVLLALWTYRKLPLAGRPPRPVPVSHRVTGLALFALTVPIAVHCLIAYGVQLTSLRVAVHSIAGCFFYGAFTAKVLLVQSRRLPGWALLAAGSMHQGRSGLDGEDASATLLPDGQVLVPAVRTRNSTRCPAPSCTTRRPAPGPVPAAWPAPARAGPPPCWTTARC